MPKPTGTNHELLTMALAGAEAEMARIDAAIAEIQARLEKRAGALKRTLSLAARKRNAAAQRKRWADVKSHQASKTTVKKIRLVAKAQKVAASA